MTLDSKFRIVFLAMIVFFLAFGWLVLLFSATGLFYVETVAMSIFVSVVLALLILPKISQNINLKAGKIFYLVVLVSVLVSLTTCYFATPTVFGGRDQGSIGTAAIYLAKNHSLIVQNPIARDLFQKYGAGKALNFPGFDYTKNGDLISRFPLGYTAYLASAYDLAGLKGIQYANFLPLFFFLLIFWLILREFFDNKVAFLGFLIAAAFFPFQWFAKYALTETYMLFLVWTGVLFLICFAKQKRELFFWLSLAAFALSALVRIEGIAFFALALVYILLLQKKKIINLSQNIYKYILLSTIFILAIYVYLNFPDLLDSTKNLVKAFLPNSTKESAPSANLYSYLARTFFNYNLLPYSILGLVGILWLAKNIRKSWVKIEFLPIFITFPTFLYLLSPMISLDEPWFLRRFVFAVFPALLIYSIYILEKFFYHKIFLYLTLVALIGANGVVAGRFLATSENKDLLPQVGKVSQKFGPDDLILVDPLSTASGFSLASEPLRTIFGKQAVYFMNADDLQYIDQARYKNIYLLAPFMTEGQPWYAALIKGKSPDDAQVFTNNFLEPAESRFALAVNVEAKDLMVIWKVK
ncbi:MAG TPA: hypothetical protein VK254_01620 [Candidatus Bathyarchaeia archaeon]|nr:hypothetical protein [Candidatus Bathyarchaeia archaeon]